jgi:hypothetical protein
MHQDLLEARKREMQAELDADLKQLDSERKEGLYRLDWELAEAIEALHERHAQRANQKIQQHKQFMAEMDRRAQAGEDLSPDTLRRLRSPGSLQAQEPPNFHIEVAEEEEEEESEEESEEEGVIATVMNFFRSFDDEPVPVSARGNSVDSASEFQQYYGHEAHGWQQASPARNYSAEERRLAMEGASPDATLPLPIVNGFGPPPPMFESPSMQLSSQKVDYAPSFSNPSGHVQRTSSMPSVWPPANVYHGGGRPR